MNKSALINSLEEIYKKGVSHIIDKRFFWFKNELLPLLHKVESEAPEEKEILSKIWYLIGDVHDLNRAPLCALKAYIKSLSYDPHSAGTYREIANMLQQMGKYEEALAYNKKSLELEPNERHALSDQEHLISMMEPPQANPMYKPGDIKWTMNEYLAKQEFETVIKTLKDAKGVALLKILARAYGALSKNIEYSKTWRKIEKTGKFTIAFADWFYMPPKTEIYKEIWRVKLSQNASK